jgi:hypothetical protein
MKTFYYIYRIHPDNGGQLVLIKPDVSLTEMDKHMKSNNNLYLLCGYDNKMDAQFHIDYLKKRYKFPYIDLKIGESII